MSKKNYGDYTTRIFSLASDFTVPSDAYAEVEASSFDPSNLLSPINDFYAEGETILLSTYSGNISTPKVLLYENDL